ncbi:MAG: hypothetical protein ACRD2W_13020 [Acidimicrobiales bacterium]
MAKIGAVKLAIDVHGSKAVVSVTYDVTFSAQDKKTKQLYKEACRLIGDDTHAGDPKAQAPDDTLGFMTPLFFKTQFTGAATETREFTKTFIAGDLDEDRGLVPDPDEIRARVGLTPVPPTQAKPATRESRMVKLKL